MNQFSPLFDDDELLLIIDWADSPPVTTTAPPGPVPLYPPAARIRGRASRAAITGQPTSVRVRGRRTDISIRGALPMPACDPISIAAGAAVSIPWTMPGVSLPSGIGLIFSVRDPVTGEIWLEKANQAAGGSEQQFATPASGVSMPGYINLAGIDTASGRIGDHEYDVKIIYPNGSATPSPDFPSVGVFTLIDHASR